MIRLLMRRTLGWELPALLIAFAVLAPLTALGDSDRTLGFGVGAMAVVMFRLRSSQRATLFEAALPITGRQLFLARVLSNLVLVWSAAATIVAIELWGMSATGAPSPAAAGVWPSGSLILVAAQGGTILTLAVLLPLSVRIEEFAPPLWISVVSWMAVAAAGAAAWFLLPLGVPLALFGAASVAVFLKALAAVPKSFQVAPYEAVSPAAIGPFAPAAMPTPSPTWWPALRSAFSWYSLLDFPLMAILAPSGGWFYFFAIFAVQRTYQSRQRTRWLQSMPLSPRALLAITLAATILLPLAGVVFGMQFHILGTGRTGYVGAGPLLSRESAWPNVNVPLEYWRYARAGDVPVIQAPWGEAGQPQSLSILGFTFYDPYSTSQATSREFYEWQFGRATEAFYGRPIPPALYYAGRTGKPPVIGHGRMQILSLSALLVYALLLVFLGELTRSHRLRLPSARATRVVATVLAGVPILTVYVSDMFYMNRYSTPVAVPLTKAALLHISGLLPQNLAVLIAAAAIPVMAMYWALERQFRQSEMIGQIKQPAG